MRVVPSLQDVGGALAAADLVLSRAGAATVAELHATRTPALLVPSPALSEEQQAANAQVLADTGGCVGQSVGHSGALHGPLVGWGGAGLGWAGAGRGGGVCCDGHGRGRMVALHGPLAGWGCGMKRARGTD